MKNSAGHTVVPQAVLAPIIRDWAKRNGYSIENAERSFRFGSTSESIPVGGISALSDLSGVPARRVSGILNGTLPEKNVKFDTADRLLCAMHLTSLWHSELAEYYTELETAPYERHLEVEAA